MQKVKEMKCYVAKNVMREKDTRARTKTKYRLPDNNEIELGTEVFEAPEVLFNPEIIGLESASEWVGGRDRRAEGGGGKREKEGETMRARRGGAFSCHNRARYSSPRHGFVTIGTAGPMLTRPVGFPRISSQTRPGKERKKSVNSRKWGKAIWRNFDRRLFCVCGLLSLPFA